MCDFFDDFEEEDSFEDEYEPDTEMDDPLDGDSDLDSEPDEVESQGDDFTAKDAFILGGSIGWAYSKGKEERERQRLIQKSNSKKNKES